MYIESYLGVMRVIYTARQELMSSVEAILQSLTTIIGEISKNPSNPKFNHYTFETLSSLVKYGLSYLDLLASLSQHLSSTLRTSYSGPSRLSYSKR